MASRKHLIAVNRTIKAAGLDERGLDAAIVEFARDLARQLDAVGPDGPSSRLTAAYLSATKDITRASVRKRVSKPVEPAVNQPAAPSGPPKLEIVKENPLERVRKAAGRAS